MTLAVSIRELTGHDIVPLADALGLSVPQIARRWSETLLGYRETYVADDAGLAVGIVSVNEQVELPGYSHLFALDVSQYHRSLGIGTQLIARVEDEAKLRGFEGVYLHVNVENAGARRLYERLGYAADGDPVENRWMSFADDGTAQERVEMQQRMTKSF